MNAASSRRVVITTLSLTGVLAVIRNVTAGDVPDVPRLVIGGIFAGVVLTLIADPAPELAASIASLILVGALVGNGPKVWDALSKNVLSANRKPKTSRAHAAATATGGTAPQLGKRQP